MLRDEASGCFIWNIFGSYALILCRECFTMSDLRSEFSHRLYKMRLHFVDANIYTRTFKSAFFFFILPRVPKTATHNVPALHAQCFHLICIIDAAKVFPQTHFTI